MKTKLVYFVWADETEVQRKIISDNELIKLVDEMDFTDVNIVSIFDITEPSNIFEIHYVGWQPGCLIEFADNKGNIVLRGYGEDH